MAWDNVNHLKRENRQLRLALGRDENGSMGGVVPHTVIEMASGKKTTPNVDSRGESDMPLELLELESGPVFRRTNSHQQLGITSMMTNSESNNNHDGETNLHPLLQRDHKRGN